MAQRLIDKIDRSGGAEACWPWSGTRNTNGYGVMSIPGSSRMVHRLIYEIAKGSIPDGHRVCHTCDNPPCCNPAHLFSGTAKENSLDMARKERCGQNKLTADDVRAIRADGRRTKEVAADYGVHWSNIAAIKSGATWKHIGGIKPRRKKTNLSEDQVRAIRKDTRTGYVIGAEYGLSYEQVCRIRRRERWGSVQD